MQCQKLNTYLETGRVVFLPPRAIRPNPSQPRKVFQQEALDELADSIMRHGVLQPLSVRRIGTGYELIAGERRLRAARQAGLAEIPCIVMTMDEKESTMAAMVENLHRRDLDFIEEAQGIRTLMDRWGITQEQAAQILGKSQSAVANKLRLLRHGDEVLAMIRKGGLTERHARVLLKLPTEEEKKTLIQEIVESNLTVAQTERRVSRHLAGQRSSASTPNVNRFINDLTQSLARIQLGGISAISERRETEDQIVLTITIPKY